MQVNGERDLQFAVLRSGRHPLTVIDVGANVGEWTAMLLDAAAQCDRPVRSFAFEASSFTAARLRSTLERFHSVTVENLALSDREGELELYLVGDGAGTNSVHRSSHTAPVTGTERIRATTLDLYCAERGIERIDLLKVDTEGNDLFVLRGAQRLLADQRIEIAQFEYNQRWIAPRAFLRDVFEFVEPLGYRVGKVTPAGVEMYRAWHPELETFREGNYVAIRPSWLGRLRTLSWWND